VPSAEHVVKFNPNPLQRGFIESRAMADLFSSRRGEGKSTALAWSVFYHTKHNPGAKWVMLRDTFENLQKTTMDSFFTWFPPGVFGTYHATKKEWTWAEGVASGKVYFMGMDAPDDASKLLSLEIAGAAFDEPAPAAGSGGIAEHVFDLATTSLRQPEMNWYGLKLAENNPDESHWTYKKFVDPGIEGFKLWQPVSPENLKNLPENYYENMRKTLAHRPDLVRRFVDGEFGFQQDGISVTPQWSDKLHLATGLVAMPRLPLHLLWDFGLNPTCIITQKTPMGQWLVLESAVGEGIGVAELIGDVIKPILADRYRGHELAHIGDPNGNMREQSEAARSAVKLLKRELGGTWRSGPVSFRERRDPLQSVLSRTVAGQGVVRVDRRRAREVWYALRVGWHYHQARTGVVSGEPQKNIHSHPGDAMGYGAAILFPIRPLSQFRADGKLKSDAAVYFRPIEDKFRIGPAHSGPLPQQGASPTPRPQRGYF